MNLKFGLVGIIALLPSLNKAQDSTVVRDFESWTRAQVETKLFNDKLILDWRSELRLKDNSTSRDMFLTQFGLSYEILKNFNIGAAYRYINETENQGKNQYRYQFNLDYKHKVERWKFDYRIRYQNHDYFSHGAGNNDFGAQKYRLRVKSTYNIRKWKLDPYFSSEIFYALTTENAIQYLDEVETGTLDIKGWEKMRFTLGTEIDLFKNADLGIFYRLEQDLPGFPSMLAESRINPKTTFILGLKFKYKIDLK